MNSESLYVCHISAFTLLCSADGILRTGSIHNKQLLALARFLSITRIEKTTTCWAGWVGSPCCPLSRRLLSWPANLGLFSNKGDRCMPCCSAGSIWGGCGGAFGAPLVLFRGPPRCVRVVWGGPDLAK